MEHMPVAAAMHKMLGSNNHFSFYNQNEGFSAPGISIQFRKAELFNGQVASDFLNAARQGLAKADVSKCFVRLPFPVMWIEWLDQSPNSGHKEAKWIGCLVEEVDDEIHKPSKTGTPEDDVEIVFSFMSLTVEHGIRYHPVTTAARLDSNGLVEMMYLYHVPGPKSPKWTEDLAYYYSIVATTAIDFTHCKNVKTVERQHKSRSSIKAKRKREPTFTYRTIELPGNQYASKSESDGGTRDLALHRVRGHVRTYTEDSPAFGKLAGRFWVPAHIRGSIDSGLVMGDYKIGLPRK